MAHSVAFYYYARLRTRSNLSNILDNLEWSFQSPPRPSPINGFYLRPIPDGIFGRAWSIYLYGQRHAVPV